MRTRLWRVAGITVALAILLQRGELRGVMSFELLHAPTNSNSASESN